MEILFNDLSHTMLTQRAGRRELRKRDEARGVVSNVSKGENRPTELQAKISYWLGIM